MMISIEISEPVLTSPTDYSAYVFVRMGAFSARAYFRRLRETGEVTLSGWETDQPIPDHVKQALDGYLTTYRDKLEALIPKRS